MGEKLTPHELHIPRVMEDSRRRSSDERAGAAIWAALESLVGRGFATQESSGEMEYFFITPTGRAALSAEDGKE